MFDKTKPWFSQRTRNILAVVLLVLTVIVALALLWPSRSSAEETAGQVALAFADLDYNDRQGWEERLRPLCTEEGWAFWSHSLRQGMWDQVVAKEVVTAKVELQEAPHILETWDDGSVNVQVKVRAQGRSEGSPFDQEYEYKFLLFPAGDGGWLFAGLMPAAAFESGGGK